MYRKMMKIKVLIMLLGLLVIFFAIGASNRKVNLCENMIDASVLIYNDFGGFGSGVFIDDNIILTAGHVLQVVGMGNIELADGTILMFDDFYIDDKEDIGFIFVDTNELRISKVSDSQVKLGDAVYLVGTPYSKDFKFTITKGILSHLDRDIWGDLDWKGLLQTDAEGAPGSSGGPLYNSKGEIIGVCVTGANAGGGVTLCESAESILEAYKRCKDDRFRMFKNKIR